MSDTQGNQPVEEKTTTPIPSETKPAETVDQTLPDGVSERTKVEFDKLKEHNAQLKAKLDAYEGKTSVLDELRPPTKPAGELPQVEAPDLSKQEIAEIKTKYVDENGYIDVGAFEKALETAQKAAQDAIKRASEAEKRAERVESKVRWQEESAQIKAAHAAYPQLDPKGSGFDARFYELVRNELIGQMMRGEQDVVAAAKKVSDMYTPPADVSKAKQEAVDEYKKNSAKRDNAGENNRNSTSPAAVDHDELVRKTREGDVDAIYKRLQASGN